MMLNESSLQLISSTANRHIFLATWPWSSGRQRLYPEEFEHGVSNVGTAGYTRNFLSLGTPVVLFFGGGGSPY